MMDTSLTLVQCQLVDEHVTFSLAELSRVCGAERELVLQLVEHGVIEPIGPELNLPGAALAMELLDRIAQLQRDRPGLGGVPGGP